MEKLKEAFKGKRVLFVVDDLWEAHHEPELNFVDASGDAVRPDVRIRDAVSKSGDFVAAGGMAWNLSNTKLAFTGRLEYDSITDNCCALRIFDADARAVKHLIRFKEPHDAALEAGRVLSTALEPDVVQVEWNEM